MLEYLNQIDINVFLFINYTLSNPVTDIIMPIITSQRVLQVLYAVAIIMVLWKGDSNLRWMVLFSAIALLLSDQITATYLKNWIGRLRPCHTIDLSQINLLVPCGAGKSLPSAHTANAFAQAFLWSFYYKKPRIYLFSLAALIGLSRIFVGVHYPFDIVAGTMVGAIIGILTASGFGIFKQMVIQKNKEE